jgi:phage terminase small subunit
MTDKQAKFIAEYLVDFNATKAAKRAGYSENTAYDSGYKNLKNPEIRDRIKAEIDQSIDNSKLSLKKEVIDGLKNIISDPDTRNNERIKAYELLGKYMTMFTDKVEHAGEIKIVELPPGASKL